MTRAHTDELPSSSKRGNPEEVDDESQQGRRRLKFTCSRAHSPQGHVHLCVCVCVSACVVLVRCGAPIFLHAVGTLHVQLARPAAPHPPTLRRACVPPEPPRCLHLLCLPLTVLGRTPMDPEASLPRAAFRAHQRHPAGRRTTTKRKQTTRGILNGGKETSV